MDDKPLDTRRMSIELTVPCDDRFRPIVSVVCQRVAKYVGYPEAEAALARVLPELAS